MLDELAIDYSEYLKVDNKAEVTITREPFVFGLLIAISCFSHRSAR